MAEVVTYSRQQGIITFQLSADEIAALFTTPVLLDIPVPDGATIIPTSATVHYRHGSVNFVADSEIRMAQYVEDWTDPLGDTASIPFLTEPAAVTGAFFNVAIDPTVIQQGAVWYATTPTTDPQHPGDGSITGESISVAGTGWTAGDTFELVPILTVEQEAYMVGNDITYETGTIDTVDTGGEILTYTLDGNGLGYRFLGQCTVNPLVVSGTPDTAAEIQITSIDDMANGGVTITIQYHTAPTLDEIVTGFVGYIP